VRCRTRITAGTSLSIGRTAHVQRLGAPADDVLVEVPGLHADPLGQPGPQREEGSRSLECPLQEISDAQLFGPVAEVLGVQSLALCLDDAQDVVPLAIG
jgi:hypothetical protein